MEMKTPDIRKALLTGEADAAIIASMLDDAALTEETLFYEQFLGYVSKKEPLFKHDVIRTSDVTGERLWLLDEGHCFRDQLVRFCQMEAVKISQMASIGWVVWKPLCIWWRVVRGLRLFPNWQ